MTKFAVFLISVGFLLISPSKSNAVGGISNSKIIVPSTDTVPQKRIEIEPFFSFSRTDDAVDTQNFGFGSRFTLGVLNNLEAGLNLNYLAIEVSDDSDARYDFGNIETGLKYRLFDQDDSVPFSLAYQGGVTIPTGGDDELWVFEPLGLILTKNYTDKLSSDLDFVLSFDEDDAFGIISNFGLGYFVSEKFQPVIEASYSYESPDSADNIHIINSTAGFTAPLNETLTIILGLTYDIYTENTNDELAVTAAFTFLF